jgi:hypothetical protein
MIIAVAEIRYGKIKEAQERQIFEQRTNRKSS